MICPLCDQAAEELITVAVEGGPEGAEAQICTLCAGQLDAPDAQHFRGLASTMWSEEPAIQVLAARLLARLDTGWAQDLAEQLYLDDATRAWAENLPQSSGHKDSNGVPLTAGDTVVLIKDLPVKGAGFTAKRGTAVPRISLVQDVPTQIEGRVEGQRIVILTAFVKKR